MVKSEKFERGVFYTALLPHLITYPSCFYIFYRSTKPNLTWRGLQVKFTCIGLCKLLFVFISIWKSYHETQFASWVNHCLCQYNFQRKFALLKSKSIRNKKIRPYAREVPVCHIHVSLCVKHNIFVVLYLLQYLPTNKTNIKTNIIYI